MKTSTRGESPLSATAGYASLVVDARVRYWDDAEINGIQDDEDGDLIPLKEGDSWKPVIDLATGRIKDWPEGTTADIHYTVCDDGDYWLSDIEGNRVAKWKGHYVPDAFLCVGGDCGYGDYIIMKVDGAGMIEGWTRPEIDPEEWETCQDGQPATGKLMARRSAAACSVSVDLTDAENTALDELCTQKDMTRQGVMLAALRLYQAVALGAAEVTHKQIGPCGCMGD